MRYRLLRVLLVAGLVVLAGCGGLPTGTDSGPATESSVESTESSSTSTPTTTPAPEYADLNATQVSSRHRTAVQKTGSFQSSTVLESQRSGESAMTVQVEANVEEWNDRLAVETTVDASDQSAAIESYQTPTTVYHKRTTTDRDSPQYFVVGKKESVNESIQPYSATSLARVTIIENVVTAVQFIEGEQATLDGEPVTKYTASGADAVENVGALHFTTDAQKITDFEAVLMIGEQSVVRKLSYTATVQQNGEQRTYSATVTVGGIGSTTVEKPGWTDEAIEQDG